VLRDGSLGGKLDDLVDLGAESELALDGLTVLLGAGLLVAEKSKGERNILLRDVKGGLLELTVALLANEVGGLFGDAKELLHGQLLDISITVLAGLGGVSGEVPCIGKELIEGDDGRTLLLHGADPAARPARCDEGAKSAVVPASVGRVVGGGRGGDVHVVGDVCL